jgi:hypothetical protein
MRFDLRENLCSLHPELLVERIISKTGKSESEVIAALKAIAALVCLQILIRSRQEEKLPGLFRMCKVAAGSGVHKHADELFQGNSHYQGIINMANVLFGKEHREATSILVKETGFSAALVHALLGTSTPLVLGVLGRTIKEQKLQPDSFALLISTLRSEIELQLPVSMDCSFFYKELERTVISRKKNRPLPADQSSIKRFIATKKFRIAAISIAGSGVLIYFLMS